MGLKYPVPHFYVTDSGDMADPPHWLKASQEKLGKLQRQLGRMRPGSRNYRKAVQKFRILHEHIANQRWDFIHKESRRIANGWDAVCIKSDDLAEMDRELSRSTPAGFGMFREYLRYKLERQGKTLLTVDRYIPTTRTCSACGAVRDAVHYKENTWRCPKCGAVHRREANAAKNIKAQGLARYFSLHEQCESA